MPHWTPKNYLIVLKLRPIPPSTHGESLTIWQLWHWLTTGDATLRLPPCARINRQVQRWEREIEKFIIRQPPMGEKDDGKWWGVIGSDYFRFQNLIKSWDSRFGCVHFTTCSRLKMPISSCLHLYPQCFLSCYYFARFDTKCNMINNQLEKSECSR